MSSGEHLYEIFNLDYLVTSAKIFHEAEGHYYAHLSAARFCKLNPRMRSLPGHIIPHKWTRVTILYLPNECSSVTFKIPAINEKCTAICLGADRDHILDGDMPICRFNKETYRITPLPATLCVPAAADDNMCMCETFVMLFY